MKILPKRFCAAHLRVCPSKFSPTAVNFCAYFVVFFHNSLVNQKLQRHVSRQTVAYGSTDCHFLGDFLAEKYSQKFAFSGFFTAGIGIEVSSILISLPESVNQTHIGDSGKRCPMAIQIPTFHRLESVLARLRICVGK